MSAAELAELVADYDAEIAFNDASLGVLLDELAHLGLDDSTLVIVTGDHGEEFRDHGSFNHGHTLYDELIRVPLVVRLPGRRRAGERDARLARQIDLLPTILAETGSPIPTGLPGRALFSGADDGGEVVEALSHTRLTRRDISAVVTERWKVIENLARPNVTAEVFDLVADPAEQRNVAAERAVLAGYGEQRIGRDAGLGALATRAPVQPPVIDADTERRLKALGYAD